MKLLVVVIFLSNRIKEDMITKTTTTTKTSERKFPRYNQTVKLYLRCISQVRNGTATDKRLGLQLVVIK
jgi:hypothetical protein